MGNSQIKASGRLKIFGRIMQSGRFRKLLRFVVPDIRHSTAGKRETAIQKQVMLEHARNNAESVAAISASRLMR